MKRQRKILITCAAQNAALAAIRSLHAAGWRVAALADDARAMGLASRAADEKLHLPHPPADEPKAYAAAVVDYLTRYPADVLLPVTDAAIFALLPVRDKIEALTAVPWPATDSLQAAADKTATFALARELGVATPPLAVVEHDGPLPADLVFPLVVKPRASLVAGRKIPVTYAADRAELAAALDAVPAAAFPVTLQQRIVGPGEGYFGVWRRGAPVVEFAHRRLRETPPSGGVSTLREAIPLPDDLRDAARRLLAHWHWHGPAMVEFKRDAAGRPYLMEVNGRLWGSLQLAIDAGVDVPLASALVALDEPVPPMTVRPSVRTRWLLGDLDALLARLRKSDRALRLPPGAPGRARQFADFCLDFIRPAVRPETFRWNDPRPFFAECRAWLRNRGGGIAKRLGRGGAVKMLVHMHSTISYDGELTVEDLGLLMRRNNVAVCCLTEHSRFLTEPDMQRLIAECAAHSDRRLLLVPGVEYDVAGGHHVLGLGVAKPMPFDDPARVCNAIREAGGLAVLAHPEPGELINDPALAQAVDGVEVWNTMHNGNYLPSADALDQLRRAQRKRPDLFALHGIDFHFVDNLHNSHVELRANGAELTWPNIVAALRAGRYRLTNGWIAVSSHGAGPATTALYRPLRMAQEIASKVKHTILGHRTPDCWEFLACRHGDCCPATVEKDGGELCWRVVGTFAGVDRRGPCCNFIPNCRECEFYRWRNADVYKNPPLRVLHLIETANPGGAELMMVNLAANLDRKRFTSHACLIKPGWLEQKLRENGIPVTVLPLARKMDWRFVWRLARMARRRRYDVLHSHEFTMNVYVFLAGLLARRPTVATVHGNLEYVRGRSRRRWIYQLLTRLAGPMIAVSGETQRLLIEGFGLPPQHLRVIPNGVELPAAAPTRETIRQWRREMGLPEDAALVGMIGRLQPVKGPDLIVAAMPRLIARRPDVHLALAGQGDMRPALEETVRRLGLEKSVTFLGYREDVRERLAAFDVIVAPSRNEGLSLTVVEAMAAGRPVVATRVGGTPEAIDDGIAGLLVPPEDPAALADACARLLDEPELASRLGAGARARVESLFSRERMVDEYQELYEEKTRRA